MPLRQDVGCWSLLFLQIPPEMLPGHIEEPTLLCPRCLQNLFSHTRPRMSAWRGRWATRLGGRCLYSPRRSIFFLMASNGSGAFDDSDEDLSTILGYIAIYHRGCPHHHLIYVSRSSFWTSSQRSLLKFPWIQYPPPGSLPRIGQLPLGESPLDSPVKLTKVGFAVTFVSPSLYCFSPLPPTAAAPKSSSKKPALVQLEKMTRRVVPSPKTTGRPVCPPDERVRAAIASTCAAVPCSVIERRTSDAV